MGHAAAACHFPAKCGKCWADGHIGARCNKLPQGLPPHQKTLNPAAAPFKPINTAPFNPTQVRRMEPGFDSLLSGTFPHVPPTMPESDYPTQTCFIDRDVAYYQELERLKQAIVVKTVDPLGVDKIIELCADTGLVTKEDLSFASLSGGRFLIHLPGGVDPDSLIRALPSEPWERGLDFQRWSPLEYASINIPNYTVVINIWDLPPHLYHERFVIRATSGIGLYLGTIDQVDPTNMEVYTAVIATDNLERVPPTITLVEGGLQVTLPLKVLKVATGPIYRPHEIPTMPPKHHRPTRDQTMEDTTSSEEDDDVFHCSWRVLHDICQGRDMSTIPRVVQDMLAGVIKPRFSKEDLITFLLQHEPAPTATEDPPAIEDGGRTSQYSQPDLLDVAGQYHLGSGSATNPQPQHIGEGVESSLHGRDGTTALGTDFVHKADIQAPGVDKDGRTRIPAKDKQKKQEKGGMGETIRATRQIPMKRIGKRVERKTRYGLLHTRPQGKGLQAVPGRSTGQEHLLQGEASRAPIPMNRRQPRDSCPTGLPRAKQGGKKEIRLGHKRKAAHALRPLKNQQAQSGPSEYHKEGVPGPGNGIDLERTPDGFYQVKVQYDQCAALAHGCGLHESDVEETIDEENEYLKQATTHSSGSDGDQVSLDPISDEESESEGL